MKIINIVGPPNFMKIAPLMEAYKGFAAIRPLLVHTGQHCDQKMSDLFFNHPLHRPGGLSGFPQAHVHRQDRPNRLAARRCSQPSTDRIFGQTAPAGRALPARRGDFARLRGRHLGRRKDASVTEP